jgi:hypothetical protein
MAISKNSPFNYVTTLGHFFPKNKNKNKNSVVWVLSPFYFSPNAENSHQKMLEEREGSARQLIN